MAKYKDITGQRYNMLTAVRHVGRGIWLFRCDCGAERIIQRSVVERGLVKSCGCRKIKDITGQKFGKLTAIRRVYKQVWEFKCDCGSIIQSDRYNVTSGKIVTCGCRRKDIKSNLVGKRFGWLVVRSYHGGGLWECICDCGNVVNREAGSLKANKECSCGCKQTKFVTKHGLSDEKIYHIWHGMIDRCYNPKTESYRLYGERGIRVCDRWRDENGLMNFLADMGKPTKEQSIDRIDVNGDYCPENCRWATAEEQSNNKRNNVRITYNGQTKTSAQWARQFGISASALHYRLKRGLEPPLLFYKGNLKQINEKVKKQTV